jgi:hypothetical protein
VGTLLGLTGQPEIPAWRVDDLLRKILAFGRIGIDPEKLGTLSDGIGQACRQYLQSRHLRKITSAKRLIRLLTDICRSATKLEGRFLPISQSSVEIHYILGQLGVNTDEAVEMLRRLNRAADEACAFFKCIDVGRIDASFQSRTENLDFFLQLAAGPPRRANKRNKQTSETGLFVELRDLFIRLGGGTAIGKGGPLYRFVAGSVETINDQMAADDQISMPEPEPFRKLMAAAEKRRQHRS